MKNYLLEKKGLNWDFKSEVELEDFIWFNLTTIFDLIPLERQYYVEGLYCDIIAATKSKQLVIIELKISEDRYIVQQLTRYFHYLKNNSILADKIDFNLPVKLIGIMPGIHQDNLIDLKYHRLSFDLYKYSLEHSDNKFYFKCCHALDHHKLPSVEIIREKELINTNLPEIPTKLKQILNKSNETEYQGILETRNQLLTFDSRIKESIRPLAKIK